mmetsp:Transcript_33031/g.79927  ORF Transcript_33031/g.79927 Transcript_33031/m.79927 type:complete len:291 (-) Transcript_33031:184-1056(-)
MINVPIHGPRKLLPCPLLLLVLLLLLRVGGNLLPGFDDLRLRYVYIAALTFLPFLLAFHHGRVPVLDLGHFFLLLLSPQRSILHHGLQLHAAPLRYRFLARFSTPILAALPIPAHHRPAAIVRGGVPFLDLGQLPLALLPRQISVSHDGLDLVGLSTIRGDPVRQGRGGGILCYGRRVRVARAVGIVGGRCRFGDNFGRLDRPRRAASGWLGILLRRLRGRAFHGRCRPRRGRRHRHAIEHERHQLSLLPLLTALQLHRFGLVHPLQLDQPVLAQAVFVEPFPVLPLLAH